MKKPLYSPYEVLQIPHNATPKEAKRAYKKLIRVHTPEHDPEKFMEIRDSYDEFSNPDLTKIKVEQFPIYRSIYDFANEKAVYDEVSLPKEILSDIFETPFDTPAFANELLHISEDELGFIQNEEV